LLQFRKGIVIFVGYNQNAIMNSVFLIIGLCNIAIGCGILSSKKNPSSKLNKTLSIINIIAGISLIGLSIFVE